jgi:hypothetical protein
MYGIMLPVEGLCTYDTQFFSSCREQAMKEATPYITLEQTKHVDSPEMLVQQQQQQQ